MLAPLESDSLGESIDTERGRYRDELNDVGSSSGLAPAFDVCTVLGSAFSGWVSVAWHHLKSGRALGPDLNPAEAPKHAYGVVPKIFEGFFSTCLRQGIVPKRYKITELCPILEDPSRDPQDKRAEVN